MTEQTSRSAGRATVGGVLERVRLRDLRLDWQNPRLPPAMQDPEKTQLELLLYLDKRFNPLEVAESIGRHGYFESEPLIALREGSTYLVVEGNRRLSALLGLSDPTARAALTQQTRGWRTLIGVEVPDELPVVVVESRDQVAPLLGFRHISGIKEWEAFAQARYIASLVETGRTLAEVSALVGRQERETRAMYRDHEIVRQGATEFGLDTRRAEADFGIFTAAMAIRNIRVYIYAPTPARTPIDEWPLPDESAERLAMLLLFMYGDEHGRGKALPESRQLTKLGHVLSDPTGRGERALLAGHTLDDALEAIAEPAIRFKKRLQAALTSLSYAYDDLPQRLSPGETSLVSEVYQAAARLQRRSSVGGGDAL